MSSVKRSTRSPTRSGSAIEGRQRNEHRNPRLRTHFASDVPLTFQVFGEQDVAGTEAPDGAVTDLDIDSAAEREHRVATWCVVPCICALRFEATHQNATARYQLG